MQLIRVEIFLTLILFLCNESFGSRILVVTPTTWKSHWKIGSAVVKSLAEAGHDVTFLSAFEFKKDNVRDVVLTNQPENSVNAFEMSGMLPVINFMILPEMLEKVVNFTLSHPNYQKLLGEKFDVVVVEVFHTEALLGLGTQFDCPVIGFTTFGTSAYTNIMTSSPNPISFIPNVFLSFTDKMSFTERLINAIVWELDELFLHLYHFPKQQRLYETFFPNASVPFNDQRRNLALLLNNNHFSSSTVKPSMPSVVDIGGIHVEPAKPLPKDFQDFLDSAEHGAILFSMGSIIQAVKWPEEKREAFVRAFKKLKLKVLWKYENETLPNKPENVMISPWIPQRDILAHPNVKLFITHGGLLGTTEALVEGVPVLGIPIFGDQKMNLNIAVGKGYALTVDYDDITEEKLTEAFDKIFSDPKISQKAKEISKIYNDRPMSPKDSVKYWVEYVIRHKGAKQLRSAGNDLNYFELHSLDVLTTLTVGIVLMMMVVRFGAKKILTWGNGYQGKVKVN